MSWMRYMTLKSFRMFNPEWEMTLYISDCKSNIKTWPTPETQDYHYFKGVNYMPQIKDLNIKIEHWDFDNNSILPVANNPSMGASHKSNFLKWEKLSTQGGIYSDMDIIYFKPMDAFYEALKDYNTAICQTQYLSIGLLASSGNNDFFKDIFLNGIDRYKQGEYQSAGVSNIYDLYNKIEEREEIIKTVKGKHPHLKLYDISIGCGQSAILDIAKGKYPSLNFYNIPFNLIYPFDSTQVKDAFNVNLSIEDLPEETIGYHWYAGHPITQNFNNLLTEGTYKNIISLFTNIAKEILP